MLADPPRPCDVGIKRDAKGHQTRWIGHKSHVDTADGGVPISCVPTPASVHGSQVALPLAALTADGVTSLHDLMDSACDAAEIRARSVSLGHVPIIAVNPRRQRGLKGDLAREGRRQALTGHRLAQGTRYDERTRSERVNAHLKDNHGGRSVRVRGHSKVLCHLMPGILPIAAVQILRLVPQTGPRQRRMIAAAASRCCAGAAMSQAERHERETDLDVDVGAS